MKRPRNCAICRWETEDPENIPDRPVVHRVRGGPVWSDDHGWIPFHGWLCREHYQDMAYCVKIVETEMPSAARPGDV